MRVNKLPQIPLASSKVNIKKTLIVCSGIKRNENGEGKLPPPIQIQKSWLERLLPTFTAAFKGKEEPSASQALEEAKIINPSVSGKSTEQNIISLCVDEKDQPLIEGFLRDLQVSNPNVYAALQSILKNNLSLVPELLKPEIREIISSLNIDFSLKNENEQTNALKKVKYNLIGINEESQILIESFVERLRINNQNTHLCLKLILEKNPDFSRELLKAEIRENINNLNIVALGTETEQRNALVKVKNTLRGIKEETPQINNEEEPINNFRKVVIPSLQFTRQEQAAFGALNTGFQLELMKGYYALKKLEDNNQKFPLSSNQFLELGIEEADSPFILNLKENTSPEEKLHIKLIKYFSNNSEILSTKKLAKFIDARTEEAKSAVERCENIDHIIGVLANPKNFHFYTADGCEFSEKILRNIQFLGSRLSPFASKEGNVYKFPAPVSKVLEDYFTLKPKEGRFELTRNSDGKTVILDYSNLEYLQTIVQTWKKEVSERTSALNDLMKLVEESYDEFCKSFPKIASNLELISLFDKLKLEIEGNEERLNLAKIKKLAILRKVVDAMMEAAKDDLETSYDSHNQISLYEKSWKTDPPDFRRLVQHGSLIRPEFLRHSVQATTLEFYKILDRTIERDFGTILDSAKLSSKLSKPLDQLLNSLNEKNQRLMKIARDNGTFNSTTIPLNDEIGVADRFTAETKDILKGYQKYSAMWRSTMNQALEQVNECILYSIPSRLRKIEDLTLQDKRSQVLREVVFNLFFKNDVLGPYAAKKDDSTDWLGCINETPVTEARRLLELAKEELLLLLSVDSNDPSVDIHAEIKAERRIENVEIHFNRICFPKKDSANNICSGFPLGVTLEQREGLVKLIEGFLDKAYLRLTNQDLSTPLDWEMDIESYKIEKELEEKETRKSLERAREVISKNIQERQKTINLGKCSEQSKEIFEEDVKKLEQLVSGLKPDSKAWGNNRNTIIHEIETITGISFGNYLTNTEILQGISSRESKVKKIKNYAENANNLPAEKQDNLNSLMEQLTADQKFTLLKLKSTEYLEFFERFDNTFSRIKTLVPEFQDNEKSKDEIVFTDQLLEQAKAFMRKAQREVHPDHNPTEDPAKSHELMTAYRKVKDVLGNPEAHIIDQYSEFNTFKRIVQEISGLNPDEIKKELPAEVNDQDNDSKNIEPEEDQDGGIVKPNPNTPVKPNSDGEAAEDIEAQSNNLQGSEASVESESQANSDPAINEENPSKTSSEVKPAEKSNNSSEVNWADLKENYKLSAKPLSQKEIDRLNSEQNVIGREPTVFLAKNKVVEGTAEEEEEESQQLTSYKLPEKQPESILVSNYV